MKKKSFWMLLAATILISFIACNYDENNYDDGNITGNVYNKLQGKWKYKVRYSYDEKKKDNILIFSSKGELQDMGAYPSLAGKPVSYEVIDEWTEDPKTKALNGIMKVKLLQEYIDGVLLPTTDEIVYRCLLWNDTLIFTPYASDHVKYFKDPSERFERINN